MSIRRSGRKTIVTAALCSTAVFVAACGSSTTTTTTSGSGGAPGSGTLSGPVILGDLAGFTGSEAPFGQAFNEGCQVAIREINDSGGILGQKVQISNGDELSDPIDAVAALQKLINIDHVVGIIGPQTPEIGATQPIIDRFKIPDMFQGGSTDFDQLKDPWIWRASASDSQEGVAMALYAIKKGYKNAAIMFSTEASAQTLKPVLQHIFESLGGHIVISVDLTTGQSSYRSEVQRVIDAHPDVIFDHQDPATAGTLFSNFHEANNFAIPFVGTDSTTGSDYNNAIGIPVSNAHLVSLIGGSEPGGGGDVFNKWYAKVYSHQPLANANYAYDAVMVLALAIEYANTTDPQAMVNAIPNVSNPPGTTVSDWATAVSDLKAGKKINYDGASGPMDFNQYHNVFGPFDAVQVDLQGNEQIQQTFTAADLNTATK
ncbi:MAG: ABC transporter substrate-binding protein [Candidatus Dormibacteraeota bacterium]|nr:ABC transporter substrate-binding protein [Candidatus Dormibacteraeota bacterium]